MPESRRRDRDPSPGPIVPDACPGAWRRHLAADGALARFRLVGGAVSGGELNVLAQAAAAGGAPLELTSRGSVQVRGLDARAADDLASALVSVGNRPTAVLDDRGRDLPCSLVASPRSRVLDPVVGAVATGLRERGAGEDVPGRMLVAVDDGAGDVAAEDADITVIADGTDLTALVLDGRDTGIRHRDPAALALAAVDAFLAIRDGRWRLTELPDGPSRVAADVLTRLDLARIAPSPTTVNPTGTTPLRLGADESDDGAPTAAEVLPPLGELDLAAASALVSAVSTGGELRVTPWRTVVLRDLPDPRETLATLADAGFATSPDTPWATLSACVGAPRCAKSHADVRADLRAAVSAGTAGSNGVGRAHWVGCARACGTPRGGVAVVEATPGGAYRTVVRAGRVSR